MEAALPLATRAFPGLTPNSADPPACPQRSVAEHALALTFCLARNLHLSYRRVASGNYTLSGLVGIEVGAVLVAWKVGRAVQRCAACLLSTWCRFKLPVCLPPVHLQVSGKTVGVIGTGKIGFEFCQLLRVRACSKLPSQTASICCCRKARLLCRTSLVHHGNWSRPLALTIATHPHRYYMPPPPTVQGFGCKVLAYDVYPNQTLVEQGVQYVPLEQLMAEVRLQGAVQGWLGGWASAWSLYRGRSA